MLDGPRGRKRPGDTTSSQLSLEGVNEVIEKRLFVARLPPDTEEEELRDIFIEFGALSECRIISGRNWAFVRYDNWACAHRALLATDEKKTLCNHRSGQTIAVSFAEKQVVGRGGGAHLAKGQDNSRVFVRNMAEDATEKEIEDLFGEHGEITTIQMLAPKSRRRSAFVTFAIWGEALDSIEALTGSTWPNSPKEDDMKADSFKISVVMAEPPKGQIQSQLLVPQAARLQQVPEAKRRRIDGPTAPALNFAPRGRSGSDDDPMFTEFERLKVAYLLAIDSDSPDRVCSELHESLLDLRSQMGRDRPRHGNGGGKGGHPLLRPRLGPAGGPILSEAPDPRREYPRISISGLPRECTNDELEALIDQVSDGAEVRECFVENGRGIGYVELVSDESAEIVKEALHERRVTGWDEPLSARWAPLGRSGGGGPLKLWGKRASSPRRTSRSPQAWRRDNSRSRSRGRAVEAKTSSVEGRRVYCGQLVSNVEFEDVRFLFEPFGDIQACRHIADKGMAYITYFQAVDAEAAVAALDGKVEHGVSRGEGGLKVQIAAPPTKGKGGSKGKRH